MSAQPIFQITDPQQLKMLLTPSEPVRLDAPGAKERAIQTIADLRDTLYQAVPRNHPKAAGVSAIQIGRPERIFLMHYNDMNGAQRLKAFVNANIVVFDNVPLARDWAGCFSFDFLRVSVDRPATIELVAQVFEITDSGIEYKGSREEEFTGQTAFIAQHELDHGDGVLTLHYAPERQIQEFIRVQGAASPIVIPGQRVFSIRDAYSAQGRHEEANKAPSLLLTEPQSAALRNFLEHTSLAFDLSGRTRTVCWAGPPPALAP